MASKRALITGITGQDGSYLAELLLHLKYEVYGMVRRLSTPNTSRIESFLEKVTLLQGDMLDSASLAQVIEQARPDEIYNLAAQSHVGLSFKQPLATAEYNGLGVARLLEAIRLTGNMQYVKLYQAGTSELFGEQVERCNEQSRFMPRSPYACAKLFAHNMVRTYREMGLFACNGILFNHESERRGEDFVTRKISKAVAAIYMSGGRNIEKLHLGNIYIQRDWGYAPDFVPAMWKMLQADKADDYVIATGEAHSIVEFLAIAFKYIGVDDWGKYVQIDDTFKRPSDIRWLCGDATRAKEELHWNPVYCVNFEWLVEKMVQSDIDRLLKERGYAHKDRKEVNQRGTAEALDGEA